LNLFGDICRMNNSRLMKQVIFGMVDGSGIRGRSNKEWFDKIKEWCQMDVSSASLRDLRLFTLYVRHFLHLSRCLDAWTFLPSCSSSSSRRHLYVIFKPSITSHCQCLQPQQRLQQPSSSWLSFEPTARDAVSASPHYTLPVACRSSLRRRCPAYQSSSNSLSADRCCSLQ